ncbi:MAG: pyridoxal phosphate-dependent aminotransferase [Ilumatobacteraceae bacterium]|nr:pyridoxal phosphate-dependent aminotransferase [Ilumatobacteraceae bacterium]
MTPREPLAHRLQGFGASIFAEMTALAVSTGAINLGQGFPDYDGPRDVLDEAIRNVAEGNNQYPPGIGVPALREAIAHHQKRFWNLSYDPDSEVLVTMGATEALAGALLGILNTNDEVVVFEPLFDTYAGCVALAGAHLSPVTLQPQSDGRYGFDADQLRNVITPNTRMILLNSPHNPTGMVFTRDELQLVADIAIEHNLIVVSDEVYEHLTFDSAVHIPIATLPGMYERTITISSGGKSFNTTGWKIGWACAPAALLNATRMAKQLFTFAGGTPFQSAIAVGLQLPDAYFEQLAADLQRKRDMLLPALRDAGLQPITPEGTYFITADIRERFPHGDSMQFCRALPAQCGVVAIPGGVLYDPRHSEEGKHIVRFAFCKQDDTIKEASQRLRSWA